MICLVIGVISDTHGFYETAKKAVNKMGRIDVLLHAGDGVSDIKKIKQHFPGLELICVSGNCDFNKIFPEERLFTLMDKRVLLTHGNRYNVKWGYINIILRAKEVKADIVVFGHTHIAEAFVDDGIVFLNPGSTALPRSGSQRSFGKLYIEENGQVKTEIKHFTL